MPKKNMTIDDLARQMREGFVNQENQLIKVIDEKIDELALITKKGFDAVDDRFGQVENRLDKVENSLNKMERRMTGLEVGHEDIKLRLDNVAYRFELNDLQKRVTILEKKASFK